MKNPIINFLISCSFVVSIYAHDHELFLPITFEDIKNMSSSAQSIDIQELIGKHDVRYMGSKDQRALLAKLFNQQLTKAELHPIETNLKRLLQDFNVFKLQTNDTEYHDQSLFRQINRTVTTAGELVLSHLIANPLNDVTTVQQRQRSVQHFIDNNDYATQLDRLLNIYKKEHEAGTLGMLNTQSKIEKNHCNKIIFTSKFLQSFNSNEYAMSGDAIADLAIQTLIGFLPWFAVWQGVPVLLGKERNLSIFQALKDFGKSHLEVLQGQHNKFETISMISMDAFSVYLGYIFNKKYREKLHAHRYIHQQLIHVAETVKIFDSVNKLINTPENSEGMKYIRESWEQILQDTNKNNDIEFETLLSMLRSNTLVGNASAISHQGRVRAAYSLLQKHKDRIAQMIRCIGIVDAHRSIAKLYQEHQSTPNKYTFADIVDQPDALVEARQFWNPLVGAEKAVANDLTLSQDSKQGARIALVTGANSGGKSTISSSFATSNLLARTLGIVPAQQYRATLFDCMASSLKIQDNPAQGQSHFVAETDTAAKILKKVQQLSLSGKKSFLLIDELFEGTDAETGRASLRNVAQKLSQCHNTLCVMVTQHKDLEGPVGLEAETPQLLKNYRVDVTLDKVIDASTGELEEKITGRPFLLQKGYSNQKIGNKLLQEAFEKHGVH